MESTSRRRPWRATISATSAMGLRMPDVVSQWTAKTWLIALSSPSIRSSRARSGGVSSGVSSDAVARPAIWAILSARWP